MRHLLLIFFILSVNVNLFALTRGDIRTEIRYKVDDTTTTYATARWSDAVLNNRINIVQQNIAQFTNCIYKKYTASTTVNQSEYRMPSDCRTIDRVSFLISITTTAYKKLTYTSMAQKDRDVPLWENLPAGVPLEYYERGNYVGLIPAPPSAYCNVSTMSLRIDYYANATDMSSDTETPWSGDYSLTPYHYLIIVGVTAMCKQDDRLWGEVDRYFTEYNTGITLMKQYIFVKPDGGLK